jgi:GT2 family glycosyltransferase
MIHILIPTYNRLKFTIECINSLKKQTTSELLNIIVIDDLSQDNTQNYLRKHFPEITILSGTGSYFWTGAVYYGIEHALKISKPKDWLLLVNNDVVLAENTIKKLISISENFDRKAIVGALTLNKSDKRTIIKSGTIVKSWFFNITNHVFQAKDYSKLSKKDKDYINVDFLTGRCLLHPIEIFSTVGNYDLKNFPHYGSDDEFSMRIKKKNYKTILSLNSIIYLQNEIDVKKNNFLSTLFSIKSSSNLTNKFFLTLKIVPWYAKLTYFFIGVIKSIYIFILR